jgi:predicted CoA-binding protein
MKKTVVLGATTNPARVSYDAVRRLTRQGHEVVPIGVRRGEVAGIPIRHGQPPLDDVHTVTLYLNSTRQVEYYDYILDVLRPERLIFNPGTENAELARRARERGIEVVVACTLVMVAMGSY